MTNKEQDLVARIGGVTCDIEDYMFLQDNELYDIYFSHNIYNISQDIS